MFLNLFLNAKDAMPGGGTLMISTNNGHHVQVTVSDTGTGIAQEHIHRIYDPFFTTKNKPKTGHSGGTGLGLSVTYGIIQEHAGKIRVDSVAGPGHHLHHGIPHGQKGSQCLKQPSVECTSGRDEFTALGSVLIIDDEAAIRESLQTLLEFEGYEVEMAQRRRGRPDPHRRASLRPGAARLCLARAQRHRDPARHSRARLRAGRSS